MINVRMYFGGSRAWGMCCRMSTPQAPRWRFESNLKMGLDVNASTGSGMTGLPFDFRVDYEVHVGTVFRLALATIVEVEMIMFLLGTSVGLQEIGPSWPRGPCKADP